MGQNLEDFSSSEDVLSLSGALFPEETHFIPARIIIRISKKTITIYSILFPPTLSTK